MTLGQEGKWTHCHSLRLECQQSDCKIEKNYYILLQLLLLSTINSLTMLAKKESSFTCSSGTINRRISLSVFKSKTAMELGAHCFGDPKISANPLSMTQRRSHFVEETINMINVCYMKSQDVKQPRQSEFGRCWLLLNYSFLGYYLPSQLPLLQFFHLHSSHRFQWNESQLVGRWLIWD